MKYIKAYLIILLMTFSELLIGFFILKIPYALTLASVIAIIDILPVLGVGTVLIPWGIVLIILGDSFLAAGIFILYGIIWVVRQIVEPRIVGKSMGLSPLITLAAMYIGYSSIGYGGLFVFPIAAMILKCLYDIGMFKIQ
jgi:predicted PurR-regulated permease PerM